MPITNLSFGDLRIEGVSRAGEETWIRVHPPGLVFDVGRGAVQLAGARDVFLSHGHLDHALGVPFVLSLRTLHDSQSTRVFAPAAIVSGLKQLIGAAEALEGQEYEYELHAVEPGNRIPVSRGFQVEAFATDHVVPSVGYHLLGQKKRLKSEYRDRSSRELAELRSAGVEIELVQEELRLSYCGDTGPGVFDLDARVLVSPILLIECTFFDESSHQRARKYGHMHVQDLVARGADFRNQDLVLLHASRRYGCDQLRRLISTELALGSPKVHLFDC